MADKYIVKWQVQNREDGKWEDRYLGGFTMGRDGLGDYDAMIYPEGASKYPEAVAEWLCELLEATGVHPEMENLDATLEAVPYTYEVAYCTVNNKPVADLTWEEQVLDCPYVLGNCDNCPKCERIQKQGVCHYDPNELAF